MFLRAALMLFCLPCAVVSAGSITPEMDRELMAGIDCIYRMEFDAADVAAAKVIALYPEHPYGHFALAANAMMRYVYESEQTDQSLIAPFERKIAVAIDKANQWLKKHPNDAEVLFVLGSSHGLAGRLLAIRRQWIRAYFSARKAMQYTRAALVADPKMYDAYLGVGMYDYYTDVYPRLIGALAKIVLRGSRMRGIEELKIVAEKGHYSKVGAKLILVEIYTEDQFGAKSPESALRFMTEVHTLYPESAMLNAGYMVTLYECKRFEEVAAAAGRHLDHVQSGKYKPIEKAMGSLILGSALWALGRKEKALEAMRAGSTVMFGPALSHWSVYALIRAGQLEDLMGMRQQALKHYAAAAAEPDLWDLRKHAKLGLAKPHSLDAPGVIFPQ